MTSGEPIDAVITWVDGTSEFNTKRRNQYIDSYKHTLHENAINPHRWACNDEIRYCLQSIHNFAPWIRKIWIVLDGGQPNLFGVSSEVKNKISFVSHQEIFYDFEMMLPTFNSLAIESMLWRINGLSERFIYFNDDVFLTACLLPEDIFKDFIPVLRGKWVDCSEILFNSKLRKDPSKFNYYMQVNAATIAGFNANHLFSSAHVAHPLRRSVMARLFDENRESFAANIKHRFRDLSQFLPQGLHNHACIKAKEAIINKSTDYLHIKSGQGIGFPPSHTWSLLNRVDNSKIKFLCINDLPQLEAVVPETRNWLGKVIGGFDGNVPVLAGERSVHHR